MAAVRTRRLAEGGVLLSGALWGIFWLPMRAVEDAGLPGGWATLAVYALALLGLTPLIWRHRGALRAASPAFVLTGLLTGAGFAWYMTALLLTEVVRTILLFYLTPVWSTLLGRILFGRAITARRLAGLGCGLAGLVLVLGRGVGWPVPHAAGDWIALAAGLAWAYGSLRLEHDQSGGLGTAAQFIAFIAGGLIVTTVTLGLLPAGVMAAPPGLDGLMAALPMALALVALIVLPASGLAIWGAERLPAGRVGILLMTEVVVGVLSAAFLLPAEPFTWYEGMGTVAIIAATIFELSEG